ncbi:MAG: hypothetical protein ABR529_11780 [Actinomycetota bacterium]
MFVQVIHGRVTDADALRRRSELWDQELKPGAEGFLGSTIGVSNDGVMYVIARFSSEDAARRNSDRPEQDRWWQETARHLEGEVSFHDSTDVQLMRDGGSDDAGFVQVIHGRAQDIDRLRELNDQADQWLNEYRPDVIGGITAWHQGGLFTEVVYFTSEEEARAGEKRMVADSKEVRAQLEEWSSLVEDPEYTDLSEPWTSSP